MMVPHRPFGSILIANRGEIACRIIRSAQARGLQTIAVYSEADRDSLHVRMADRACYLGGAAPADSYLNIQVLCSAIIQSGAQAVHPGYGFLAENAEFAEAVIQCGAVWVGPSPQAIRAMGNKARAKELMQQAGVSCIPGYEGIDQSDAMLVHQANLIGYPIMVKAAAGGGGRGMRRVASADLLPQALARARAESLQAFGSSELILERAVLDARHVEIQIAGDAFGKMIYLGERDCSVQRRHQKLIEEAPSPAVDATLRAQMGEMAVQAAQSIEYVGVGTVECLLTGTGEFYFIEMNTRLQVEHAVTEAIFGLDLVDWQFDLAAGQRLPLSQEQAVFRGHAIEVRLTAEDVSSGFLPQSGQVLRWCPPEHLPGIRVDHCLKDMAVVSPHYDSMIAKIIAVGTTREQALSRLTGALSQCVLLGIPTNQQFLLACLRHSAFMSGDICTDFVDRYYAHGLVTPQAPTEQTIVRAALAALGLLACRGGAGQAVTSSFESRLQSVVSTVTLLRNQQTWQVSVQVLRDRTLRVWILDVRSGSLSACKGPVYLPDNLEFSCDVHLLHIFDAGCAWTFEVDDPRRGQPEQSSSAKLLAPLGARVANVLVKQGEFVLKGQALAVLEAMKMEHTITSTFDGVVTDLNVHAGTQVRAGAHLMTVVAS